MFKAVIKTNYNKTERQINRHSSVSYQSINLLRKKYFLICVLVPVGLRAVLDI